MKKVHYSEILTCGHCYNVSKMELIGSAKDNTDFWDDPNGPGVQHYDIYEVLKCPRCKKTSVRVYPWSDIADDEDVTEITILYPTEDKPRGLPDRINKAYYAAELVRSTDTYAYAILLRRMLEMVCLDQEAKAGDLFEMLRELATQNVIPHKIVDIAHGLRIFGNIGAHPGLGDLSEDEIPILNALARAILEYVYSAPELVNIANKKLSEIMEGAKKKKKLNHK